MKQELNVNRNLEEEEKKKKKKKKKKIRHVFDGQWIVRDFVILVFFH